MTANLLHDTGRALYGDRWQSALARDLGVSDRTVRYWASGAHDVPPGVWTELLELAQERAQRLDDLEARLKETA